MFLQALTTYYDRLAADPESGVAAYGYSRQQIAFVVVVNADGTLHEITDARREDNKGKLKPQRRVVIGNAKPSGIGINPCFLWDNAAYALGYDADASKQARTRASFEAFRQRHLNTAPEIDDPEFAAVCQFLIGWDPETAAEHKTLSEIGTGFGIFQIRNKTHYVHERPAVKAWWEAQLIQAEANDTGTVGQCLITGEVGPVARLHEPKIKGVWGGQPGGALLCSVDKGFTAATSYGKSQGANFPTGELTAFKYCTALNYLLDPARGRRMSIGDTSVVYWTEKPTEAENWFAELCNPNLSVGESAEEKAKTNKLRDLLDAITHGEPVEHLGPPDTKFYVLGLSPNAARVSVRFWHERTLGEMLANLGRHYADLKIGGLGWIPSPFRITCELAREPKELPPSLAGDLLRAILAGLAYPPTILAAVVRRIRAEGEVSPVRAAILKTFLVRNSGVEMDTYLNSEHPEPAYHCGRLFAVLAFAQAKALGSINAGVVRRTMGSVMATPGLMLGRLQRNAEIGHIPKLEGLGDYVHDELRAINVTLQDEIPNCLSSAKQAVFALGYYQQYQRLEFIGAQVKANKRKRSAQGEWMRSGLEVKVADCLTKAGVTYIYEPSAILPGAGERWPDFVVRGAGPTNDWYIEVMGFPGEEYDARHQKKVVAYRELGVTPEGGPKGTLVELDFREQKYDDRSVLDILRDRGFPFTMESMNA